MASKPKRQPVPKPPKGKNKPVIPGSVAPGTDKPIAPRSVLALHADSHDDDLCHPVWRLSLLDVDHDGEWSWRINGSTLDTIVQFMIQMERLTWKQIRTQQAATTTRARARHHSQQVETLAADAQRRLSELGLDDVDELFRFRVDQKGRLWGVLSRESPRVFYPIWWDDDHRVYPIDYD